jgi:caffeoyl-CoA O-methyltransferase
LRHEFKNGANFRESGLSEYIDARLADAHVLVEKVKGPFDFVFSDADKP